MSLLFFISSLIFIFLFKPVLQPAQFKDCGKSIYHVHLSAVFSFTIGFSLYCPRIFMSVMFLILNTGIPTILHEVCLIDRKRELY